MSDMVPEADAIEQLQDVERASAGDELVEGAGAAASAAAAAGGRAVSVDADPEVPEADALEQAAGVIDSDDDAPRETG